MLEWACILILTLGGRGLADVCFQYLKTKLSGRRQLDANGVEETTRVDSETANNQNSRQNDNTAVEKDGHDMIRVTFNGTVEKAFAREWLETGGRGANSMLSKALLGTPEGFRKCHNLAVEDEYVKVLGMLIQWLSEGDNYLRASLTDGNASQLYGLANYLGLQKLEEAIVVEQECREKAAREAEIASHQALVGIPSANSNPIILPLAYNIPSLPVLRRPRFTVRRRTGVLVKRKKPLALRPKSRLSRSKPRNVPVKRKPPLALRPKSRLSRSKPRNVLVKRKQPLAPRPKPLLARPKPRNVLVKRKEPLALCPKPILSRPKPTNALVKRKQPPLALRPKPLLSRPSVTDVLVKRKRKLK